MSDELFSDSKYLEAKKALELGVEGGGEALYRLLPFGSDQFIWRTYGNSIGEDEQGNEAWEDFSNEYESLDEYLLQREGMLSWMYPLFVDREFARQVRQALFKSVRRAGQNAISDFFSDHGGRWHNWKRLLPRLGRPETLRLVCFFPELPIHEMHIDVSGMQDTQNFLNFLYMSLLFDQAPERSYGRAWHLYDLDAGKRILLPPDDRSDSLLDVGISNGMNLAVFTSPV